MIRRPYYVLDANGEPLAIEDLHVWGEWWQTADRVLARTEIGASVVSTVFLGLDHRFTPGPPLLWETMVFTDGDGGDGGDQWRYATRAEALAGHASAVAELERQYRARLAP